MTFLDFLRSVYSLDTLDTRFTTPSYVPYKLATTEGRTDPGDGGRSGAQAQLAWRKPDPRAEPSKWRTPEFTLYFIILVMALPYMFWVAYDVSRPSDLRFHKFEHLLSEGWIPGRKFDASDDQYHTFRENLPYMAALLALHPVTRRLWNAVFPLSPEGDSRSAKASAAELAAARADQRTSFDFAFALMYLAVLHGFSALKVLLILSINYKLAKKLSRCYIPWATWIFNVGILFANELCRGYHFKDMAKLMVAAAGSAADVPRNMVEGEPIAVRLGSWLDHHGGLMSRWEILFNITILRLISFNLDYYWSLNSGHTTPLEKKQLDPSALSERDRITIPAPVADFTFRHYVAYAIYAPLYLAGPILTFNDYMAQVRYRAVSIETWRTVRYGVRFLLCLLTMEVVLHFNYTGAISHAAPDWGSYTAAQLSLLSYHNLHLIWLKLLLPWRLFRLWALVDGIDAPENMIRCVSDNYSTLMFWRAWHRSYNRWLIRYMWVPLGGADLRSWASTLRSVAGYLLVFTFVALWHDIKMRLLIWGWLIVLFMLPEFAAARIFPRRRWEARPTAYRMLCCVGGVANVLMMMAANLVGFAVGLDGLESIVQGILQDWSGFLFLVTACATLFVGVQLMFEIRQSELRQGINLRC